MNPMRSRDSDLRSNRCCVCRHQEGLEITRDLPGTGWRCIDRNACRQRVHDILTNHRQLAAIMNPSA